MHSTSSNSSQSSQGLELVDHIATALQATIATMPAARQPALVDHLGRGLDDPAFDSVVEVLPPCDFDGPDAEPTRQLRPFAAIKTQKDLEVAMRAYGLDGYLAHQEHLREDGCASSSDAIRHLLGDILRRVSGALHEDLERERARKKKGRRGGRPEDVPKLLLDAGADVDVVAYVALCELINALGRAHAVVLPYELLRDVGRAVQHELIAQRIPSSRWATLREDFTGEMVEVSRHQLLVKEAVTVKKPSVASSWSVEQTDKLGAHLLAIVEATCFEYFKCSRDVECDADAFWTNVGWSTTPLLRARIADADAEAALDERRWLPMIEEPAPWTSARGGGYLTLNSPLLGDGRKSAREQAALEYEESEGLLDVHEVYKALNAHQAVEWTVDPDVLHVAEHFLSLGIEGDRRLPPPPRAGETTSSIAHAIHTRRANAKAAIETARDTWDRHHEGVSIEERRELVLRGDGPPLWMPMRLDRRGRVYTRAATLSPQGTDLHRALVRFKYSKPLEGPEGYEALLRHFANVAGLPTRDGRTTDKLEHDEQVAWAESHLIEAELIAKDPVGTVEVWRKAAEPWQYLAACFEMARLREHVLARGLPVEAFESALPVAVDASCSGLQHFSLMMLDEAGAKATNLLAGPRQDAYQQVADALVATLERVGVDNPGSEGDLASTWLDSEVIDRSFVKKAVMAAPYGITDHGVAHSISEHLADHNLRFQPRAVRFIVPKVWESLDAVVVKAKEAMAWLQDVFELLAASGHEPMWITPVGFKAWCSYRAQRTEVINTRLYGKFNGLRTRTNMAHDSERLDVAKYVRGSAPNFIHSLDSAHLVAAVNEFKRRGGGDVATIHDCFVTTAADMPLMRKVLLQTLVEQYREYPLEDLKAQLEARFPGVVLPKPPARGDLDLSAVLEAEYAFS